MPFDGNEKGGGRDVVLGRLVQARSRLGERRNWISGKYFEEDGRGHHYCVLGAMAANPAEDGCMSYDADGRQAVVWLAMQVSGVRMGFEEAARVIYNFNDGSAALEQVSHSVAGWLFFARRRRIDGHQRVLDMLDHAIKSRQRELALRTAPAEI